MIPRWIKSALWIFLLLAVMLGLFLLFPVLFKFAEGAARSAFRLWWLILLLALGIWLIWGVSRRPK